MTHVHKQFSDWSKKMIFTLFSFFFKNESDNSGLYISKLKLEGLCFWFFKLHFKEKKK